MCAWCDIFVAPEGPHIWWHNKIDLERTIKAIFEFLKLRGVAVIQVGLFFLLGYYFVIGLEDSASLPLGNGLGH